MAHEPTPADIREAQRRQDEERWSAAELQEERQQRRDLLFRLPMGRALDHADLAAMIDEGNQTTRAIVMRRRLLMYALSQAPAGILVGPADVEQARAHMKAHPSEAGALPGIPEWMPSS